MVKLVRQVSENTQKSTKNLRQNWTKSDSQLGIPSSILDNLLLMLCNP
jgi:hypothetical protein